VVLQKTSPVTMNLFGANTPVIDEFFTIPELPAFDLARDIALTEPGVMGVTSQVSTRAVLDIFGSRQAVLVCGADPGTYFDLFPGLVLEAGRFLEPGEYGALITEERARQIQESTGTYPEPGSSLVLTAAGTIGFKIREIPLVGTYRYKNAGPLMNEIIITDPQTARILASIQVASSDVQAGEESHGLLDSAMDELFGGGIDEIPESPEADGDFSPGALAAYLSGGTEPSGEEPELLYGGDWNFIILRLERGGSAGEVIASLNKKINPMGLSAVSWRIAAGNSAILLFLIQFFFNSGIVLMSSAGIVAAVNILLISVLKRNFEIGTLRAIGAGDGYIRVLVLGENLILSCAAGALGILAGFCSIQAINRAGIAVSNSLIASLMGGSVLNLHFMPGMAALSFGVALFMGLAASVFPVETAVRVNPIIAVRRGA
jgi:hypothetical protein